MRSVDDYLKLPYTIQCVWDEEGQGWFAQVLELRGCFTCAETWAELGEMIQDAMRGWIEFCIEEGLPVPIPKEANDDSRGIG